MERRTCLLWNGNILEYHSWKQRIITELRKLDCEEYEKIDFIKRNIGRRRIKSSLHYVSSVEEIFQSLDANMYVFPAIMNLLKGLERLPSHPIKTSVENENIQNMIRYVQILKLNEKELPFGFEALCQSKLSKFNQNDVFQKSLDKDEILNVLYKTQEVNVRMNTTMEMKVPGVSDEKKQIMSKLSRIRKKTYDLIKREDRSALYQAQNYKAQTTRFIKKFNISGDHEKKWLAKIEKTVHDSSKLTPPSHIQGMEEENGKEDHSVTNVAVVKIGDDNENDLAALEMDPVKDNQCHEDTGAESANDDFVNHAQYNPQAKENINLPDVPEDDPTDDNLFARLYTLKRFNRKLAQEKTKNVLSDPMQDINILEGNKMIPYDPDTHGAEEGSGQNEPIMSGTPPRTGGCRYPVSSVPGYVEGKNNWFQGGQEQRVTPETVMFYSAQLDAENKESEKPKPQPMIDNNKKNNQQPAVVTGMVLIMLITMVLNSVEQINRKIESPSKNCSCACYIWIKEKYWRTIIECFCLKAETLSSNVKMMIFKMKNNIFLWMKQRKEEILNWTIQFLEAIK